MTALRDAADRVARLGRLPAPRLDRRLETEKAAERIELLVADAAARELVQEDWDAFLNRIGVIDG
jgi:hypothetical protein